MMKENPVILFGAGKLATRYIKILTQLPVPILFLVDNDQQKWYGNLCGIKIMPPSSLYENNAPIVIANNDRGVITRQLEQMELEGRIRSFPAIIGQSYKPFLDFNTKKIKSGMQNDKKWTVVIDNLYGIWGGAESWAHIVGEELKARKNPVLIIGNNKPAPQFDKNKSELLFDVEGSDPAVLLHQIIETMYMQMPVTLIDITSDYVLWAACILKNYYPNQVNIITAVLNDIAVLHERQLECRSYIDSYFCISTKLQKMFINQYGITPDRVHYRAPFADYSIEVQKRYNLEAHNPIQIGYACRLCKTQKRADLLPLLIGKLEERGINYQMNIAGDGECLRGIKEYIDNNHLTSKVKICGFLEKAKMAEYWKRQDIYLNFSEFEGTSLTMLDAMSYSAVPVVTEVSGVGDFIDNKVNGLIYSVGDMGGIADGILYLDQNRMLLQQYGDICRKRIHEQCGLDTYIDYIETLLNL